MKTLMYFLVVAILFIAGCAKDDTMFETQDNLELKKAKVPIPFKADLYIVPDLESDLILVEGLNPEDPSSYANSRLIVNGTGTHLGRINAEKSFYEFESLKFYLDENGYPFTLNTGAGIIVAANGDSFEFTFRIIQDAIDYSWSGTNEIIPGSGTGKFEGYTGTIEAVGGLHEDGIGIWSLAQGYLEFE